MDAEILLEEKWREIIHAAQDRVAIMDNEHDAICEHLEDEYDFDDPIRSLEWELHTAQRDRIAFQMDEILIQAQLDWVAFVLERTPNVTIRWEGMNCEVDHQKYFAKMR